MTKTAFRVGTSGYVYDHWKGTFYPEDLPRKEWFRHYSERFDTVEINNTFYRLPSEDVVRQWKRAAPEGFLYAFKASRYITHMKRLLPGGRYDDPVGTMLDRFEILGEHLGPVLFQLPPQMPIDAKRLRSFLERLPQGRARFVFEFRHDSWHVPEIFDLLGEFGVAFCIHDLGGQPTPREVTAKLVYVRFHGYREPYRDLYGPHRLAPWTKRIAEWRKGRHDVFVYFNNDEAAYATQDATWLRNRVIARGRRALTSLS